jgi:bifunctional DNA-binding transcriptional regulator/antitoxin component of YhaV-PrlF toxin-antitoxin module
MGMDKQTVLTVTAKGQVTLKRDLLDHLGVQPGDKITIELHSPHEALIRAAPRDGIERFFGCLPARSVSVSLDDMDRAIEDGWTRKAS